MGIIDFTRERPKAATIIFLLTGFLIGFIIGILFLPTVGISLLIVMGVMGVIAAFFNGIKRPDVVYKIVPEKQLTEKEKKEYERVGKGNDFQ